MISLSEARPEVEKNNQFKVHFRSQISKMHKNGASALHKMDRFGAG
jgi:hypothetical protein